MYPRQLLLATMAQTDRVNNADILALFGGGVLGCWFDPSDFSTMFQDEAGTIPVTAVGQLVGRILDKSGNGIHATAPSGKEPTLSQDAGGSYRLQWATGKYMKLVSTLNMNTGFSAFGFSDTPTARCILSSAAAGYLRTNGGFFGRNNGGANPTSTISVKNRHSVGYLTDGTSTTIVYDFLQKKSDITSTATGGLSGLLYFGTFDASNTSLDWQGGFHQIILVAGTVSSSNQTKILKYIAQKMISLTP